MPTPTLPQARRQYALQQSLAVGVVAAIRRLFAATQKPSIQQIASTAGHYQLAAATLTPRIIAGYADSSQSQTRALNFMGVSSLGFPLTEPIVATIDRQVPAPPVEVPDPWWDDARAFMADLERLLASEIQDAARTASQVEVVTRPEWTNYVRMLNPPSCGRCAILAGRIYRDLEAFQRHPLCDCVMVPVTDWQDAHDQGLISSPQAAFDAGQIRGLSEADTKAIADGADISQVVNAAQGIVKAGAFGRTVNATTTGTTRRAAWRKANPTRLVRLRPESIYEIAKDHADAVRLLKLYGYIT